MRRELGTGVLSGGPPDLTGHNSGFWVMLGARRMLAMIALPLHPFTLPSHLQPAFLTFGHKFREDYMAEVTVASALGFIDQRFSSASTPAWAMASSISERAPLAAMPPIVWPSTMIGSPP